MLRNLFVLFCFFSATAVAQHDKPAVHGMVIFGTNKIYASHLPMFHSPHNYQVLLEIKFSDPIKKNAFVRDQQLHPEHATYTIEPVRFVLPEQIRTRSPYTANVYRGHFERGGTKILEDVRFEIVNVLHFREFESGDSRSTEPHYLVFGNSREQYAVHKITQKPDFDHIVQVSADPVFLQDSVVQITFPSRENQVLNVSGNVVDAYTPQRPVRLIFLRQIYLEFDDLRDH